jgi:hypothetical protein
VFHREGENTLVTEFERARCEPPARWDASGGIVKRERYIARCGTARMYSLSQARTALSDPRWFYREPLRRLTHYRTGLNYNPDGVDVFAEDWDNLIVLDAARYDEFERCCAIDGRLEKRLSRGATSSEFIRGNFTDRTLHDTVYVSANPHYARLREALDVELHDYIPLHGDEFRDAAGGLTTHPETVTEQTLLANETYPQKRLVVHYLQPHQPYLGPSASHLRHGRGLIGTLHRNDLSRRELRSYYRENLELVLEEVAALGDELRGKTVVTADHGEMLGERLFGSPIREFGHWDGMYSDELLEIPWFAMTHTERKKTVAETPQRSTDIDTESVEEQLQNLGYRV